MGRRRRSSVVPFVLLGAAVSLGVVAVTASRFGWRRAKGEGEPAAMPESVATPETDATAGAQATPQTEPRFRHALRWDAPPEEYAAATSGDPPSP